MTARRIAVILALLVASLATMGAGWLSGPRWGAGVRGFVQPPSVARVSGADTKVAWNADPDCIHFDALDDYGIASETGLVSGGNPRTFMMWISDESLSGTSIVFNYGNTSGNGTVVSLQFYTDGMALSPSGYSKYATITRSSDWKNYAWTISGSGSTTTLEYVKFYINGIEQTNTAYSLGTKESTIGTLIGYQLLFNKWILGGYPGSKKMAEIAFFDVVLSPEQIQAYAPYRFAGTESNLIRLYHCDEGSGNILTDSVGGKNVTLYGATWSNK